MDTLKLPAPVELKLEGLIGLISHETGMRLATLAAEVPADQTVVEIGSFRGKSGCYLGIGSKYGFHAPVFCVDPWNLEGNVYGKHGFTDPQVYKDFLEQRMRMDLIQVVSPIRGFSIDVARDWNKGPVGLLYIDGDHNYDSVHDDFHAWHDHLAPDAVVAFDDYATRNKGVTKFVDQLSRRGWHVDTTTLPLAILHRPL